MKIKVHYNEETGIVQGYYPDSIKYSAIPEPFIEIDEKDQDKTGKMMVVIEGIYQEYIKSDEEALSELKQIKIEEVRKGKDNFIYLPVEYLGAKFLNSEVSGNNLQAAYSFIDDPIEWLDIEGNQVTLTKIQVKELIGLILQQRSKGYFLEAQFKKQINDCSTIDELNNLVLDFK